MRRLAPARPRAPRAPRPPLRARKCRGECVLGYRVVCFSSYSSLVGDNNNLASRFWVGTVARHIRRATTLWCEDPTRARTQLAKINSSRRKPQNFRPTREDPSVRKHTARRSSKARGTFSPPCTNRRYYFFFPVTGHTGAVFPDEENNVPSALYAVAMPQSKAKRRLKRAWNEPRSSR